MLVSPILLFCSERSGSNLISKIFDAHPDVCAPGASHLFRVMSECACKYPVASDTLRTAVLRLFNTKPSRWAIDAWPSYDLKSLLSNLSRANEMAAALYAAEAQTTGKKHVFVKENSAFRYLHFVHSICETPRFLFMVRDPRDMALSWTQGPVMRGGILRATERWIYDQRGYLAALPHFPSEARVSFLRYEDLISTPRSEIRRVCKELELEFDPSMENFHKHSSSAKADAKLSSMWSNLDKPIISDNSEKYHAFMTQEEIAYIEAATGVLMKTFGYHSARIGKPPFGSFKNLDALRAHLAEREPIDKPEYKTLDAKERRRFERWSKLYDRMSKLPPLPPDQLFGNRA